MLYETAARSAELLALDVEDLDLPSQRARVRCKGGAIDVIVWQTGTARLLPRLLKGRTAGPVFITARKARVQLPAADLDPSGRARLSYQQAAALFSKASGGATLHQLRHSALTHEAEKGTGTPVLMARSGHTSVRSLARYARVSAEARPPPGRARSGAAPVKGAGNNGPVSTAMASSFLSGPDVGCGTKWPVHWRRVGVGWRSLTGRASASGPPLVGAARSAGAGWCTADRSLTWTPLSVMSATSWGERQPARGLVSRYPAATWTGTTI